MLSVQNMITAMLIIDITYVFRYCCRLLYSAPGQACLGKFELSFSTKMCCSCTQAAFVVWSGASRRARGDQTEQSSSTLYA